MRPRVVLLLSLCLLASCRRSDQAAESFDLLGATATSGAPGGHYALRAYRYHQGERLALVGFTERPGPEGSGPAFLMLCRLPNRDLSLNESKSGSGVAGAQVFWQYRFAPAGGYSFGVRYELRDQPPVELWGIDGKSYAVADGRVVLADLRQDPAVVTQVKADLSGLFPTTEPNLEQMKAGLDKLRERDWSVRNFLGPTR
jgi:hypothetical protein